MFTAEGKVIEFANIKDVGEKQLYIIYSDSLRV